MSCPPPRRPPPLTCWPLAQKLLAAERTAVAPHSASQMHRPRHHGSGRGGPELTVHGGRRERPVLRQTFSSAPESPGKTPRSREPSQDGSVSGSLLTSGLPPTPGASGASPGPGATPHTGRTMVHAGKPRPGAQPLPAQPVGTVFLWSLRGRAAVSVEIRGSLASPPREPPLSLLLGLLARVPSGLCRWVGRKA